jgi:hypothetical protein
MAYIKNPKDIYDLFENLDFTFQNINWHVLGKKKPDLEGAFKNARCLQNDLDTLIGKLEEELNKNSSA